jgi:hypothetical protein
MNKDSNNKNNQSGASRDNLRPTRTKDHMDKNCRWVEIFTKGGISGPLDFEFINDDRPPQNPMKTERTYKDYRVPSIKRAIIQSIVLSLSGLILYTLIVLHIFGQSVH